MSRKFSLLFFAAAVAVITACSNISAPNRDDDQSDDPDSSEYCGVIVGSHTHCDTTIG